MALDPQGDKPLYHKLALELSNQIERGVYKTGDMIPSENSLTKLYGVSRVTVRKALAHLVDEEILTKRKGVGTFVSHPIFVESIAANGSFSLSCAQRGSTPSTRIISQGVQWASKKVATALDLSEGDSVFRVDRLRLVDGIPAILESDFFPESLSFLEHENLTIRPILDVISDGCGRVGRRHFDVFEVRYLTRSQAGILDCMASSAVLGVSQTVFDEKDEPLYFDDQLIRSDIYKYVSGN